MHVHQGDEVLRLISGEVVVRCGTNGARAGTVTWLSSPGVPHGFRVVTESVLEVVAEYDIGTLYPVAVDGSEVSFSKCIALTCAASPGLIRACGNQAALTARRLFPVDT